MSGPRDIVIVGRDAALWLTATALRQALAPTGVSVTAVELPTRLGPASAYATLPAIESFHARLGLDEAALLSATRGSFSLGTNILPADRPPFFLAYGAYGAPIDSADFFPLWVKARRFGLEAQLEDFSPTAMAARHGRVLLPDEDTERFGRTDYSYHLPAIAYAAMLKRRAQQLGVAIHHATEVQAELGRSGVILAVRLDSDLKIAGDLFVDASGSDSVLLGQALGVASESWSSYFPLDRRLTALAPHFASVPTYTELRLSPAGWTALFASQAPTNLVHAYRSGGQSDEQAIATASATTGLALGDAVITTVAPAIREVAWIANCVAIGPSACALDPLFDLDLHSVQLGIVHLLSLFPTTVTPVAERAEYNRITRSHFERLRDFQAALYLLAGLSPASPPSLQAKLDIFLARGASAPMEDETFNPDQWRALFVGLGLMPKTWPPAIESVPPERMKDGFRQILGFVRTKVLEQPTHDHYLAEIGATGTA